MTINTVNVVGFSSANNNALQTNNDANGAPPSMSRGTPPGDTEAARAAADARVKKDYFAQPSAGARVSVPAESTLGRWLEALSVVVGSSAFQRLEHTFGGQGALTHIDHKKGEIWFEGGQKKIDKNSPELNDIPGAKALLERLMAIAKKLMPSGTLSRKDVLKIDGSVQNTVNATVVEPFVYRPDPGALPDQHVPAGILGETAEAETLHNLVAALKKHIEAPGTKPDLESVLVEIAPHSVHWREDQPQPFTMNLKQLMTAYGLQVPTTLAELANLEGVLFAPPLTAPSAGDYGGLLSKDVPLSEDAQKKILEAVSTWKAGQTQVLLDAKDQVANLFEYLKRAVPESLKPLADTDPEAFLRALINTPQARALGKQLQEAIDAFPTAASGQEALLAALGLEADPAGGMERNNLAGYNLRKQDNWGRSPAEIVRRFEKHLEGRFGPQRAKVVAYQLLAMSAPEFLVKDVPSSLVYGSQQWASFSTAVLRREQDTSGSSAGKTYAEIMQRDALGPVTEAEESQLQFAAMQSVVDWGIANGVIEARSDDSYSTGTVERAATALQKQVDGLAGAAKAMAAAMPERRALALVELRRVYGVEMERFFEYKTLLGDLPVGSRKRGTYSLLDIYMSGDLNKHDWTSSDETFPTAVIQAGFSKLPDIKAKFETQFEAYVDDLKSASITFFNYQLSQLPVEDRKMIEYGKVTTFSLGVPNKGAQGPIRPDHSMFKYVSSDAILIRAERDGRTCHYLYSPSQGTIIKDADPSRPGLQFPSSRLYFSMSRPGRPGEQEDTVTVLWQPLRSPWPKKDKIDFAAFSIYPSKSLASQLPEPYVMPRTDVPSARNNELGSIVGAYYSRGVLDQKVAAKGETVQERDERRNKAAGKFLLSLIPFYDSITRFIKGDALAGVLYAVLDVIGLVVPAVKGGSLAVKAGPRGLGAALNFLKGFAKSGLKAANPLAGAYDVGRSVFMLGKRGIKSLSRAKLPLFDKLRVGRSHSGSWNIPRAGNKEPVASGIYRPLGESTEAVPALAVQRNGKWYAYDPKTRLAYGAPLKGFTPNVVPSVVEKASGVTTDTAIDITIDAVSQSDTPARPPLPVSRYQAQLERQINVDAVGRDTQATRAARAQALRLAVQQANKDLMAQIGDKARGLETPPADGSTGLQVNLDQMEAALTEMEDLIQTNQRLFSVSFERYRSDIIDPLSISAVPARLAAIQKRLDVVKKALQSVESDSGIED